MRLSPAGIGKIIGLLLCLLIVGVVLFMLQPKYSISGSVVVQTVDYESPGANIKVYLMDNSIDKQLDQMVEDYLVFQNARQSQAVINLGKEFLVKNKALENVILEPANNTFDIQNFIQDNLDIEPTKEEQLLAKLSGPLSEDEKEELTERINLYNQNANYCRQQGAICQVGSNMYSKAAEYWQKKAELLKDKGRLIFDASSFRYKTALLAGGGLGREALQVVSREKGIDLTKIEMALAKINQNVAEAIVEKEPVVLKKDYKFDTNAVLVAATKIERLLKEDFHLVIEGTTDLLKKKIIKSVKTDINGNFVFKGKEIQPGNYYIFTQYNVLSNEGEPVEFTWFKNVTINNKLFKLNKDVKVDLTIANQSNPKTLEIELPTQEELFANFCIEIENKLNQSK